MALALPLPPAPAGGAVDLSALRVAEPSVFDATSGTELVALASDQASASPGGSNLNGLHNVRVVFPAGWDGGSPALVTLRGRDGAEVEESFTYVGPGEHSVEGVEVGTRIVGVAAPGTGAGALSLSVQVGARFCAALAPVAEFIGLFAVGADLTASLTAADLTRGTVRIGGEVDAQAYTLLYQPA